MVPTESNYVTQHYENARTGWNPHETILTVANVPQLKQLFTQRVDAQTYAQPLYMHGVAIPGQGTHNVVFVATENDSVYAFDADASLPVLWRRTLVPTGETPVSSSDVLCNNVAPVIGITSTPVIDPGTATMYVVAKTKRVQAAQTTFHQYLYALDITTGHDRAGSPKEIHASIVGTGGSVSFIPQWQMNRPGLLLEQGRVYIAFGSHCDSHPGQYHGWILAYDARTLNQVGTFVAAPDTARSAIWQGGMGLAIDPTGNIYFTTGNGAFTANQPGGKDYGDSVLKLGSDLKVLDFFTPADQDVLNRADIDLGSGGVLVLPDQPAGSTSHPHLLVMCGKDGRIFLLDRENLGKYNGPNGPDRVVQTLPLQPGRPVTSQPGVWGGPAYYQGPDGQFVYYCGSRDHLKAFKLFNGLLSPATVGTDQPNQSAEIFSGEGGTTPTVSSNQQTAGTAVVWALVRSNPLRLRAYDATNLTVKLFDGNAGPWTNPGGGAFIEPTVIQGKVYVASDKQLSVFGL
ncbi:MAG: pyrrolo-quinoline quinone [Chloroflexi bacterium]|nr:pyrrolo-quinoline quinone [Chloroflexota bacterium]